MSIHLQQQLDCYEFSQSNDLTQTNVWFNVEPDIYFYFSNDVDYNKNIQNNNNDNVETSFYSNHDHHDLQTKHIQSGYHEEFESNNDHLASIELLHILKKRKCSFTFVW